jgi:hypothetical protein
MPITAGKLSDGQAFKAGTQEPVATPLRGVFPWPSLLTMQLHYSVLDVER